MRHLCPAHGVYDGVYRARSQLRRVSVVHVAGAASSNGILFQGLDGAPTETVPDPGSNIPSFSRLPVVGNQFEHCSKNITILVDSYGRGCGCQSDVFSGVCVRSGYYDNVTSLFVDRLYVFCARASCYPAMASDSHERNISLHPR